MAASSCYGNRNAKLEKCVNSKVIQEEAIVRSRAPGSCLPRPPGAPACGLRKHLRTSQRLGCIPGASPGTSVSQGMAPLRPPSLSCSSAFLAGMAREACASHCNKPRRNRTPLRRWCRQPGIAGHCQRWLGMCLEEGCHPQVSFEPFFQTLRKMPLEHSDFSLSRPVYSPTIAKKRILCLHKMQNL